ncbi:epidermal growth factor receptor kinase substrate 8-like protein 2 [Contarinia nasturtii]|uniref:epidermal growth factor receptor kinase substrate 8-like protein 2 n=1 Tax=Contarinia nasturtii TaxID=265458 RepID=UPI0012D38B43|nr:epidermal growth factor receptor kinase substrate 8-like protein 2 [Contarinia nasturtii]
MPFHANRADAGTANGSSSGNYSGDDLRSGTGQYDRYDNDLMDKPIYLLEHLATFTVNQESGILYPADGMRRLLQLEKSTGIWSQKMKLCLDRQWILIMDYETGNIIERFPASLIKEPTAFTSNGPTELYNNILVFIVDGGTGSRSEMHIFQCQSISAIHLVEDLKQLRDGKSITEHHDVMHHQSQSYGKPQSGRERHHSNVDATVTGYNNRDNDTDSELGLCGGGNGGGINDDASSTSSEKYERDVVVLNHCFDDIEKFIARLQHAAAASRELERRRRNRKSKKKDPGEGLLTLRTKPPHEKEFIDIFAKFKLSFNLLAKLKAHIHDPNAPELVHFLFTPLALIVDASHDTYYDPNLPARVINPLLTREAINLLINCVTSKETELWRSLGDAWSIPRDQWKGQGMVMYHPVFFDGWSPDYPVIDELEAHAGTPSPQNDAPNPTQSSVSIHHKLIKQNSNPSANAIKRRMEQQQQMYSIDYDYDMQPSSGHAGAPHSPAMRDFSARSDISIDSIERNGGLTDVTVANPNESMIQSSPVWLESLAARGAKLVQVTYPRTANNDKELTVSRGEYLEILDDTRKWWKARNIRGQVAHVPHTIVTPFNFTGNNVANNSNAASGSAVPETNTNDAFAPKKNSRVVNDAVLDRYTQYGNENHQQPSAAAQADWIRNKHIDKKQQYTDSNIPKPPPFLGDITKQDKQNNNNIKSLNAAVQTIATIHVPKQTTDNNDRNKSNKSKEPPTTTTATTAAAATMTPAHNSIGSDNRENMNDELAKVLKLYREKNHNWDIHKTPEIFIQPTSSPANVKLWLKAKGFSDYVITKFGYLNGQELFSLDRETLEDHCGIEEGRRLLSQITVQRNVSGYKTTRTSELLACLAKARKRIDEH